MGVHGRFDEMDLETQLRLIDLNVRSTVHLATLLTRDMVVREEGRLLFVSSIAAKGPGPGHAAYAASKAFVHSFAEAIAPGAARHGGERDVPAAGSDGHRVLRARRACRTPWWRAAPKDDPRDVARQGVEALMAGKDQVVAGATRNTLQAAAASVVPDRVAATLAARQTQEKHDEATYVDDDRSEAP